MMDILQLIESSTSYEGSELDAGLFANTTFSLAPDVPRMAAVHTPLLHGDAPMARVKAHSRYTHTVPAPHVQENGIRCRQPFTTTSTRAPSRFGEVHRVREIFNREIVSSLLEYFRVHPLNAPCATRARVLIVRTCYSCVRCACSSRCQ